MDYEIYQEEGLVLCECDGRFRLYDLNRKKSVFDTDLKYLRVENESGLIFTPDKVYSLAGKELFRMLSSKEAPVKIIRFRQNILLISEMDGLCHVILWNGSSILLELHGFEVIRHRHFFAVKTEKCWRIFKACGTEITLDELILPEKSLDFGFDFIVCGQAGSYELYSLTDGNFIAGGFIKVIPSKTSHFALCFSVSDRLAHLLVENKQWLSVEADDGYILSEKHRTFAVRRGDKFFLYEFDGTLYSDASFEQGFDFACMKGDILLTRNNGEFSIYSKNK